jgi:hypothetical protein
LNRRERPLTFRAVSAGLQISFQAALTPASALHVASVPRLRDRHVPTRRLRGRRNTVQLIAGHYIRALQDQTGPPGIAPSGGIDALPGQRLSLCEWATASSQVA